MFDVFCVLNFGAGGTHSPGGHSDGSAALDHGAMIATWPDDNEKESDRRHEEKPRRVIGAIGDDSLETLNAHYSKGSN